MKKIIGLSLFLISANVLAAATTGAELGYFDQKKHMPSGANLRFTSHHIVDVVNETSQPQNANICDQIVTCPNTNYEKSMRYCFTINLSPYEHKRDDRWIELIVNYNFHGQQCFIYAQTDTNGVGTSSSRDTKKFIVG